MKLVNSGDLAGGVIIDMGANTDEEYVVKVYATRDDIHRRVVIATQLFTNSENYTKDICEASAVHVFSFDVANSADNDDEPLNLIPALYILSTCTWSMVSPRMSVRCGVPSCFALVR